MRVDRASLRAQCEGDSEEKLAMIAASGDYSDEARAVARDGGASGDGGR